MVQFNLPQNSKVLKGQYFKDKTGSSNLKLVHIYRWDPQKNENPREDTFEVNLDMCGNKVLDILNKIKFFREMHRILKKDGKLIIQEAYCSLLLKIATLIMKHEGYDFTKDVWSESIPLAARDLWAGNIAVPHLLFDNKDSFNKNLGSIFKIVHESTSECFLFLNSGGVCSRTYYIPLNNFFLNIINKIDNILTKAFPKIFATGRQLVLKKI